MDYKPGDIANGHILGNDGVWHPMPVAGTAETPRKRRSHRTTIWVGAIVALCVVGLVGGLAASEDSQLDPPSSQSNDLPLIDELRTHTTAWNETLAPVVADYLDPNVEADDWVVEAGPIFGELEPMIGAMGNVASKISDAALRNQVMAIIDNYRAKLKAFTKLVNAVSVGDSGAEGTAQKELDQASQDGTRLAEELIATFEN